MATYSAEYRERKRLQMAARRRDPIKGEAVRAAGRRAYAKGGLEKQRQRAAVKKVEFFPWRVQYARRFDPTITVEQIKNLWDVQEGRCGLTGRPLGVDAQLDHIVPLARGGEGAISNLRWVTPEANRAKRDLTDEEFLQLSNDVIEYLGRRIMAVLA